MRGHLLYCMMTSGDQSGAAVDHAFFSRRGYQWGMGSRGPVTITPRWRGHCTPTYLSWESKVPFTRTIYSIEPGDFSWEVLEVLLPSCSWEDRRTFRSPVLHHLHSVRDQSSDRGSCRGHLKTRERRSGKEAQTVHPTGRRTRSERSPIRVDETRIFHRPFKSDSPAASPDYSTDINPDSKLEEGFSRLDS